MVDRRSDSVRRAARAGSTALVVSLMSVDRTGVSLRDAISPCPSGEALRHVGVGGSAPTALAVFGLLAIALGGCGARAVSTSQPAARSAASPATGSRPCTVVWTGPATRHFGTARDWSTGRVPGRVDVACVPRGVTIRVDRGRYVVSSLIDGGNLDVSGDYLSLQDNCIDSEVGNVNLSGGVLNIGKCPPGRRVVEICIRYSPVIPECTPRDAAAERAARATWRTFAQLVNANIAATPARGRARARLMAMLTSRACVPYWKRMPGSASALAADCRQTIANLTDVREGARPLALDITALWIHGNQAAGSVREQGSIRIARFAAGGGCSP